MPKLAAEYYIAMLKFIMFGNEIPDRLDFPELTDTERNMLDSKATEFCEMVNRKFNNNRR